MREVEERRIAPEMDDDGRGFTVRWSKGGFASVLSCRFGFVLYLPPETYHVTFRPYAGESGGASWHEDAAGFDAVVLPELAGQDEGLPPPLVLVLNARFAQRLEGLPKELRLHIGND
jgi:hypothetical protein